MIEYILDYKQLDDETRLLFVSEPLTIYYYLLVQTYNHEDEEIYRSEELEDVATKFKEY